MDSHPPAQMYKRFYGLRERPFDLNPDTRFLFLSAQHREALSTLQHSIATSDGVAVPIGEAGTGKTTLIKAVLASIPAPLHRLAARPSRPVRLRRTSGLPKSPQRRRCRFSHQSREAKLRRRSHW